VHFLDQWSARLWVVYQHWCERASPCDACDPRRCSRPAADWWDLTRSRICHAYAGPRWLAGGLLPTYGAVLISLNGGTLWGFANVGTLSGLTAVASDASGKHVWAVGTTAGICNASSLASLAVPYYASQPTIIYSGNYGQSWTNQSAPAIPGAYYQLNAVAVLTGSMAFAAGGNPFAQDGIVAPSAFAFGTIIATSNGGFSWTQQPIASYDSSMGTLTNTAFGSSAAIPVINSIAFMTPMVGTQVGMYVGWAVGENGLMVKTTGGVPMRSRSKSGQIATATLQWTTLSVGSGGSYPLAALYPSGSVAAGSFPNLYSLYQVIWDNNEVGYVFGQGIILSTHNQGATWQPEAPPAVQAKGIWLFAAANGARASCATDV